MTTIEKLDQIYAEYLLDLERCEKDFCSSRGAFARMFMGTSYQNGCHTRFAEEMKTALGAVDPTAEEVRPIIEHVLDKGTEPQSSKAVSMMLTAMQQYLTPLLKFESREYLSELATRYDKTFPKAVRTPVMVDFRKALNKAASKT